MMSIDSNVAALRANFVAKYFSRLTTVKVEKKGHQFVTLHFCSEFFLIVQNFGQEILRALLSGGAKKFVFRTIF